MNENEQPQIQTRRLREWTAGNITNAPDWIRTSTPKKAQALNLLRMPFRHWGLATIILSLRYLSTLRRLTTSFPWMASFEYGASHLDYFHPTEAVPNSSCLLERCPERGVRHPHPQGGKGRDDHPTEPQGQYLTASHRYAILEHHLPRAVDHPIGENSTSMILSRLIAPNSSLCPTCSGRQLHNRGTILANVPC